MYNDKKFKTVMESRKEVQWNCVILVLIFYVGLIVVSGMCELEKEIVLTILLLSFPLAAVTFLDVIRIIITHIKVSIREKAVSEGEYISGVIGYEHIKTITENGMYVYTMKIYYRDDTGFHEWETEPYFSSMRNLIPEDRRCRLYKYEGKLHMEGIPLSLEAYTDYDEFGEELWWSDELIELRYEAGEISGLSGKERKYALAQRRNKVFWRSKEHIVLMAVPIVVGNNRCVIHSDARINSVEWVSSDELGLNLRLLECVKSMQEMNDYITKDYVIEHLSDMIKMWIKQAKSTICVEKVNIEIEFV